MSTRLYCLALLLVVMLFCLSITNGCVTASPPARDPVRPDGTVLPVPSYTNTPLPWVFTNVVEVL